MKRITAIATLAVLLLCGTVGASVMTVVVRQGVSAPADWSITKIGSQQTNSTTTVAVTTTQTVSSGGLLVVVLGKNSDVTWTCSDNGPGLSYTLRETAYDSSNGNTLGTFTAPVSSAISSGAVITVAGLTADDWAVYVYSLNNFTDYDVGAATTNSWRTTGHVTGTTSAITGSSDAAISVYGNYTSGTVTNTWSGATLLDTVSFSSRDFMISWKNVTSGTQAGGFNLQNGSTSAACITVVK